MSDFSAINTALTGLLAQQEALDTTAHNVSNANTPGYTRERVDLAPIGGTTVPAQWAGTSPIGRGVAVQGIERLGDRFLELRSLGDHAASSDLSRTQQILTNAEAGFAEPGPNGLSSALADFWSAWDDVANNPTDLGARNALIGKAQTVTTTFNQAAAGLQSLWESSLSQLQAQAVQVNSVASSIAQLNEHIRVGHNAGLPLNDLIDQRNQLIAQLAASVGATTSDNPDGTTDVFIGSNALVRGSVASSVAVNQSTAGVQLQWNGMGSPAPPVAVTGGDAHALLTALNTTLPNYLSGLSAIATTLAQAVNSQQANGFTLATPPASSQAGPPMLATAQLAGTLAGEPALPQLSVAAGFTPDQIAAASSPGAPGDGSNAQTIAELASSPSGADAQYRSFISTLGSDVQRAQTQSGIQQAVTAQGDAALQGQEGVNTDEEMANMVSFQHAYDAAARVLTTVDSMLDTLINHTGLTA